MKIAVQAHDFDTAAEIAALHKNNAQVGAVAIFIGTVRDMNEGTGVARMTLEHYPGMTEKALTAIAEQAGQRWSIFDCTIIHRVGALAPTEQIVFVGVASAHRAEAFAACVFMMDYLKTQAPFWKKEDTPLGARWVDARSVDDAAVARWAAAPTAASTKCST